MVPRPSSTKEKLLKLMADKDKLEAKINENGAILSTNGNVGMDGPLVDSAGFPRSDIDVYRVRQARHEIICMQNDHKELMKQIETLMHKLHSEAAEEERNEDSIESGTSRMQIDEHPTSTNGVSHANGSNVSLQVIANINLVSPGSPAEDAGLRVDDQLIEFGTVNSRNFQNNLNEIAQIVRHMENQRVPIKVKRDNEILNITLVPKAWNGRGLLGCNIVLI